MVVDKGVETFCGKGWPRESTNGFVICCFDMKDGGLFATSVVANGPLDLEVTSAGYEGIASVAVTVGKSDLGLVESVEVIVGGGED